MGIHPNRSLDCVIPIERNHNDTKRPGAAAKASYRSNMTGSLPVGRLILPEEQAFTHLWNQAARGRSQSELPLEHNWFASRWSLNLARNTNTFVEQSPQRKPDPVTARADEVLVQTG
jgi:hypothetical protein